MVLTIVILALIATTAFSVLTALIMWRAIYRAYSVKKGGKRDET